MEGLEVRARRLSVNELFVVTRVGARLSSLDDSEADESMDELAATLAGPILSWNLDDMHGQPVPITPTALRDQDLRLLKAINIALMRASAGVSDPLPEGSNSGEPALEASIPMTALPPENPQS